MIEEEKDLENLFEAVVDYFDSPKVMTESCAKFFQDLDQLVNIIFASVIPEIKIQHLKAQSKKQELIDLMHHEKMPETSKQMLAEMSLCRAVDNYLVYISDMMRLIFKSRPETLKSSEKVALEIILEYKSMDELIAGLVERRVHQLSYEGLPKLAEHLSKKLGFDLFESYNHLYLAATAVEARNLIVHNRGVVNDIYISRLNRYHKMILKEGSPGNLKIDQRLELGQNALALVLIGFLARSVHDIDNRAAKKFHLEQPVG